MYGNERNVPMTGVCRSACRMTGKKDLILVSRVLRAHVPEETDEADKLDADARHGPLEEDEEAGVSGLGAKWREQNSALQLAGSRSLALATRRCARDATHMPPKKHTVPRHFSRREKK